MSQFDFGTVNPDIKSGTQLASDLNSWRDALNSMHRGNTRPTYAVQGMMWIDDTSTPWLIKMYNGASLGTDTVVATYNQTTGAFSSVTDGDKGDITVSNSGATWTIDNNVVTPAQMSRTGTAGQVLTSNGADADPSYQAHAPGVEAGSIIYVAKNTAPTGYLKANGAAISRTTYATLFAAIGTTFGVGDGSTTFTLPDLRGEFVRGWDDSRGVDSGRVLGSSQSSQNLSHNHGNATVFGSSWTAYAVGGGGLPIGAGTMALDGGSEARPRNIALLACIKY